MRSSNPVFSRADGFNGRGSASGMSYPTQGSPQYAPPAPQYGGQQYGGPTGGAPTGYAPASTERMTIDSVVQKTGLTLGVVVVVAVATWFLTGPITDPQALTTLYTLSMVGALGGFALSMVNSFKRVVSPGLVLAYAALEGIFVGAFSKAMEAQFGSGDGTGLVMGAVAGTFAAVAGTLAAYKFFDIKVGQKFRTWVVAAMFGFVAVSLLDFVLGFFSADIGVNGFGGMGLVMSLVGLGLGVLMLILDFDFVERGVAAGLPERESWRAAFGLTVTIIWIYIELLRILAILRGND
ncbi:Bax inhibitor-1/YccA family protein [Nocardioides mesophilus]|uniref:Bax inhibitor-1/YccA family protein n=1 Tax=Nocardioides mesophilus TaxID=433659 RepID=A0A7G9R7P6_9ACTN|nr:Bax inhibitor-1/YccA family protein [Nocardioides mesophilus]QNN51621.1 Bax inhibitor-1/YccA family protein [Nocardioides mesophilus]